MLEGTTIRAGASSVRRRTRQYEWPRWETPRKQGKPYNGGKAREEHLTVWKDGHEKTAEVEHWCDYALESTKKTRTTGEKMEATNLRDGWKLKKTPATGTNWKMCTACAATEPSETSTASTPQHLPLQQPLQQSPHDSRLLHCCADAQRSSFTTRS